MNTKVFLHPFLLLVVALFLFPRATQGFDTLVELIPSRLEGKTRGQSVHVADLKFGTPRKTLRAGLDFAGSKVTTIIPQTSEISSTYTPAGGGSELIWISGNRLRLPVTTDAYKVESLCSRCEGLIGVGPASPLWMVWKEATFGSGAVSLGSLADIIKDADAFNRLEIPSQLDNHIHCAIGFTEGLCKTTALVGPNKDLVNVIFLFEERSTLVPDAVYDAYTDGKNIELTDNEDWDDLEFDFIDLTVDSPASFVRTRIRRHDMVSETEIGTNQLNIGVSPLNDTVFIGRTAFRSFFVHMRWIPNTIQVINWKVEKSYEGYIGFVLIIVGLSLVWWNGTRSGMWSMQWKPRPRRILGMLFFSVISFITIWTTNTRCAIREFLIVDVFFQVFTYLFLLLAWGAILLHLIMRYGYGRNTVWVYRIFGLTYAEHTFIQEHEEAQMHNRASFDTSKNTKERLRRSVNQVSIGDALRSIGNRKILPLEKYMWYNANVGSQRLWSIITVSGDMVLFSTLILAWNTTREDTLTGIGSLLLFSFMIIIASYHLISHFYHRGGHHTLAWYAFIGFSVVHLVLAILVAEVYIYYPFIHRFVPDYSNTPSVISFLFTLGLFYFAESIAKARVTYRGILYKHKDK